MIFLNRPYLEGNEKQYLNDVIDSGWLLRHKYVDKFEEYFGYISKLKYNKAVTSGTTALTLACKAMGSSKVAVPKYSCFSVPEGIYHSGAEMVFVDSEIETYGMDYEDLIKAYEKYGFDTVVLVHTYGYPARDTKKIAKFCTKYGISLIEDCCEAHGAKIDLQTVGTFGDIAVYSMRSEKMIGIGEGGMVCTNNEGTDKIIRYWCDDARSGWGVRFWAKGNGWNFNICEIQGAVGLAQVEQFDVIKKRKITIGEIYKEEFERLTSVVSMKKFENVNPVYWLNAIRYIRGYPSKDDIISVMNEHDVEMRPAFYPADKLPAFRDYKTTESSNAEKLFREILVFPSNVYMETEDVYKVINMFMGVLNGDRIDKFNNDKY